MSQENRQSPCRMYFNLPCDCIFTVVVGCLQNSVGNIWFNHLPYIQLCHLILAAGNLSVLYSRGSKPVGLFTGKDENLD